MKIKSIKLEGFRRFKDLTIKGLPKEARLVVMVGPNGSGKSSVFDALLRFKDRKGGNSTRTVNSYLVRFDMSEADFTEPKIEFHTEPSTRDAWIRSVHMRSAYRNDLIDNPDRLVTASRPLTSERRFYILSENDQAVASNYGRILNQWIEFGSAVEQRGENMGEIQDKIFGELRNAMGELFKERQLILTGLGSPKDNRIFEFDKGTNLGLSYENLSSGEKAALDLILDIIVFRVEFNDTVFCIDEPEAHIHTKLQGPLLDQLYKLIPDNSQLWIATHSVGMVRKAQDLWREDPNSVVFLDFGKEDLDFDDVTIITPTPPNPKLWERIYDIALGDIAELVASEQYIFCEGEDFDETCYQNIFGSYHPETRFISITGKGTVEKVVEKLKGKITKGAKVIGVVDRDRRTGDGIKRKTKEGIRTLKWGKIEDYLLHDEVLTQLCVSQGKSNKVQEFLTAQNKKIDEVIKDDTIRDKRRPIIQRIQEQAEIVLGLSHSGDTVADFMTDILAPLIKPGMAVYEQLHSDIFGE